MEGTVRHWLKKLGKYLTEEEIRSSIYRGVLDVVESFDRERGFKVSTLAVNRMRGAILDDLREADPVSRGNRSIQKMIERATEDFIRAHGKAPTTSEVIESLGLTKEQLMNFLIDVNLGGAVSLSRKTKTQEGDESLTLGDLIEDRSEPDPSDTVIAKEVEDRIRRELKKFGRDGEVFSLYLLDDVSMADIGLGLRLSESRVCQILTNAEYLERLKKVMGIENPPIRVLKI